MKLSLISRSLLITGPLLLSPVAANADQLPNNLNGWYQTEDGRRYFIEEKNGKVNLTRYNPQSGFPISAFQGNINQQRTAISGTLKSCTVGHENYRDFAFQARHTGAQRGLGFNDRDGWKQLYPGSPLRHAKIGPICASWLAGDFENRNHSLYRTSSSPTTYLYYSKEDNTLPENTPYKYYPIYRVTVAEDSYNSPLFIYQICRDRQDRSRASWDSERYYNHFRSYKRNAEVYKSIFSTGRPTFTTLQASRSRTGALIAVTSDMFPDRFYNGSTNKPKVMSCSR